MPRLDGEVFIRMPKKEVMGYRRLVGKNFAEEVRRAIRKHFKNVKLVSLEKISA